MPTKDQAEAKTQSRLAQINYQAALESRKVQTGRLPGCETVDMVRERLDAARKQAQKNAGMVITGSGQN